MSNLTNRSKLFLKKKKAQYGDFIRDSVSYIDSDVFSQKPLYSQKQKEQSSFIDSLPVIGSIGQIIGGIAGIFEGNRQERIQNIHESASAEDLRQRREKARANNFYITPYTTGRTDNLTARKGLNVPFYQNGGQMDLFMDFYNQQEQSSKMLQKHLSDIYKDKNERLEQEANNTKKDAFGNIFEGATGLLGFLQKGGIIPESTFVKPVATNKLDHLIIPDRVRREDARVEFFGRENPAKIDPLQQAYIKNTIMPDIEAYKDYKKEMYGADSQKLTTLRDRNWQQRRRRDNWVREKQEGGEIEAPDTESLYSSDFQSPVEDQGFSENEIQNFLTSTSPGEEMQKNSNLLSWLFEENPLDTYTTNDIYHSTYQSVNVPKGDIATTHSNPGNIKYGKFAQKYGAQPGRAATDGGIFAVFPSVKAGLQAQKDLLTSGSYANLTVGDAMKRWSNSGYGADLYPQIANKRMKDLTSQELNELILRQTKRESPTIYKKIYGNTK